MTQQQITACIDGSAISTSVCDTAAWASQRLQAPLNFLHILEKSHSPIQEDLSGAIGLGSREHLLKAFTELDAQRNKLAMEHGKHVLEDAKTRAKAAGADQITTDQRHDRLLDALLEIDSKTRLFVIGRLGEDHKMHQPVIGSQVEQVVRSVSTPILVATGVFSRPSNFMLAYDGSETASIAIDKIASSPLLADLPGHLVMVGKDTHENRERLEQARLRLSTNTQHTTKSKHTADSERIQSHLIQGTVVEALLGFQNKMDIQLNVMGAYGHSRIREFILGSHTTKMLAASTAPTLILR